MQINKLLTPYNFTDANDTGRIKYIVIHYVGALGGAKANCQYYAGQYIGASAHYYVGFSGEIWQSVPDEDIAWHCGAKSYKHAECRNTNSIGIELCVRKKNTAHLGAEDKDWYFEDATVRAAAELTRYLMDKYGVPASRVIRHYDVTGKICPNPYVYNATAHKWDEFRGLISGAEVTEPQQNPQGAGSYKVKVEIDDLNIRVGAGTNYAKTGGYTGKGVFTIVEEKAGQGSTAGWGRLKSGAGWASLDYCIKIAGSETGTAETGTTDGGDTESTIWEFLTGKGLNAYAAAGLMGNLYAESGLAANNLQNSYSTKLGMSDEEYTAAVDNGSYTNFVHDSAGYGLAQWTYYSRKQALYDYAKAAGASIGNLDMQLDFLWQELRGYKSVMEKLTAATSVRAASDAVLLGYEKPADQSEAVQKKRAEYGQNFYNIYAGKKNEEAEPEPQKPAAAVPYTVKIDISDLNIRTGAGTNYAKTGEYTGKGVFTIVEEKAGQGSTAGWGRLKSGAGWVSLDYCTKLA